MGRYIGPTCRLCRREGMKLYLKGDKCYTDKCPVARRGYAPGQHGQEKKNSLTTACNYEKNKNSKGTMAF